MKVESHLILKGFLAFLTTTKSFGYHCFRMFLLDMSFHIIFSSKGNSAMWAADSLFWGSTAFLMTMVMGGMLNPDTALGTLLSNFIHDSIRTRRCEQFNTLK